MNALSIWYLALRAGHEGGLDSYDGFVVIAATEAEARAAVRCADECGGDRHAPDHACVWRDPERSTCEAIGAAALGSQPCVVLGSFNAG